jgi:hypothetical protein
MQLITLKTFDNAIDAHMVCSKLESEGIQTFLFDENIISLNPLYNNMIGGIKLKIAEDDLDQATKILTAMDASPLTDENDNVITCPKCNSQKVTPGHRSIKSFGGVIAFIISIAFLVFPFYKSMKKCENCGFEFK